MQYSVTRLLVTKKAVEKELAKMLEAKPTEVTSTVKSSVSQEEKNKIKSRQKAFLDKLTATMTLRDKIAAAIAESNAATKVTINGKTMTVTAAIDRKNNIELEKKFCNLLIAAGTQVERQLEQAERSIVQEASNRAQILSGTGKTVTKEAMDLAKASVEELYKLDVVEPCDILKLAVSKRTELDLFIAEVDIALNEANATTKIEIDLVV